MKIIFTGGGTLGSVTPLLALYEELSPSAQAIWIGTRHGPEKELVRAYHMPFRGIFSGKLRRYFSIRNFLDPLLLCIGVFQAVRIISAFGPDVIIGAGGYVSVPVLWAGWLLKKKIVIFQLDIQPTMSNMLTRFCAQKIALACEQNAGFWGKNAVVTGIPVRKRVYERAQEMQDEKKRVQLRAQLGIPLDSFPIVFVVGGGAGAAAINICVREALGDLTRMCHVIHVTGMGKGGDPSVQYVQERYYTFGFLKEEMIDYVALADCVVTRAGMGVLSELSILGKPTIIIPIPHSHQEKNAVYFERQKHAAIYLAQEGLTGEKLARTVARVLDDAVLRTELSDHMKQALPREGAQKIRKLIEEIIKK